MSEDRQNFLQLPREDQRDAYVVGAEQLGRNETSLEKDVWVCWVLDALFTCPDLPALAFKGGTSLSKAYGAIARFSEDIDITMDCRKLVDDLDPFAPDLSRKQRDRNSDRLEAAVAEVSVRKVVPHLQARLATLPAPGGQLRVEDDGEVLVVEYPTVLAIPEPYYREGVKIEFGGRNMTEPHERHTLTPYWPPSSPTLPSSRPQ